MDISVQSRTPPVKQERRHGRIEAVEVVRQLQAIAEEMHNVREKGKSLALPRSGRESMPPPGPREVFCPLLCYMDLHAVIKQLVVEEDVAIHGGIHAKVEGVGSR